MRKLYCTQWYSVELSRSKKVLRQCLWPNPLNDTFPHCTQPNHTSNVTTSNSFHQFFFFSPFLLPIHLRPLPPQSSLLLTKPSNLVLKPSLFLPIDNWRTSDLSSPYALHIGHKHHCSILLFLYLRLDFVGTLFDIECREKY